MSDDEVICYGQAGEWPISDCESDYDEYFYSKPEVIDVFDDDDETSGKRKRPCYYVSYDDTEDVQIIWSSFFRVKKKHKVNIFNLLNYFIIHFFLHLLNLVI